MSDFTDTTISTWNQRHPPQTTEYPSVLSDRFKVIDRDRTFPRRIDFDTSNLMPRDPCTSYADTVYRSAIHEHMESISDQLTKVLSTGAGSSHINGSLADSGIQTDNTSTSVPQIYVADAQTYTLNLKILKDAAVDTRNENNLQDIPFIDDDDDEKFLKRRTNILEKHKSMSNIPEKIDEVSSKEHSIERLSSSFNRAKSPSFVEKFKKFFTDIGIVKSESTPNNHDDITLNTLPKSTISSNYKTRTLPPVEVRDSSTLPKDMRFRRVRSTQTVYIKSNSPVLSRDQEIQTNEHVSVVKVNGDEYIKDSKSERQIKGSESETVIQATEFERVVKGIKSDRVIKQTESEGNVKDMVYIKNIGSSEIYKGKDSGSTIIVVPPAD